ncbi:hypothetical protein BpHYR1_002858, partial [Brachionus plicatilis]
MYDFTFFSTVLLPDTMTQTMQLVFFCQVPRSSHNQRCTASGQCMASAPNTLTCLSGTCQCRNFNNGPTSGTQVYWSVTNKNCLSCPTGYSSGWGSGVYNSPNRITNRCFRIVRSNSYTYDSAQASCQTALILGRRANLITIRNIMELNMIKTQFWQSGYNFVVGSRTSTPLVFTWNFDGSKAVQNTFYCIDQPNNAGSNQFVLVFQSGYCLDDLANTASYNIYLVYLFRKKGEMHNVIELYDNIMSLNETRSTINTNKIEPQNRRYSTATKNCFYVKLREITFFH